MAGLETSCGAHHSNCNCWRGIRHHGKQFNPAWSIGTGGRLLVLVPHYCGSVGNKTLLDMSVSVVLSDISHHVMSMFYRRALWMFVIFSGARSRGNALVQLTLDETMDTVKEGQ